MRWMITAAALTAAAAWATAISVGVTAHVAQQPTMIVVYLVNAAVLATTITVALLLTDRLQGQLDEARAERDALRTGLDDGLELGRQILTELRSENDQADRALRALLDDDNSNPRIRHIRS